MYMLYSGKLLREKTSWIGEKYDFRKENVRGLITFAAPKDATPPPQILRRKLSRIATKRRKFSPSKVSHYTVYWQWYTWNKWQLLQDIICALWPVNPGENADVCVCHFLPQVYCNTVDETGGVQPCRNVFVVASFPGSHAWQRGFWEWACVCCYS